MTYHVGVKMEKPRFWESSQPTLSYELVEYIITKDLGVKQDLGNRAHVKGP